MALTGQQFPIAAGAHEATVVEVGAGLRRYVHAGEDVTCAYRADEMPPKCSGVSLVPWPNRLRGGRYTFDGATLQLPLTEPVLGNAIHGLGRWERWTPVRHEPELVTLALDVVPQTGWPFEVRVEVSYALDAERGLAVTALARNLGRTRAPFGAGFHPYLSTRGAHLADTTVRLPAAVRLLLDDHKVPIGTRAVAGTPYDLTRARRLGAVRMDDAFTALQTVDGRGTAEVRGHDGGARLWFDETFRYLQVFTVDDLAGGGPGVAIEPMTCAPDAFNSGDGLIVLDPGGAWTGSWGIVPN